MRNFAVWMLASTVAVPLPSHAQSTLADQKLQAEIDKLKAETEKITVDTGKSRIDADNAALAALRAVPNATATVSEAGKTTELTLLRRAVASGAAARLADKLAAVVPPAQGITPKVVIGTTPPSIDQWLWFKDQRIEVARKLVEANDAWRSATSSKNSFVAISGVVALAATVLPMLKSDTVLTGVDGKLDNDELLHVTYVALVRKGYQIDDTEFRVSDYIAARDELLQPLSAAHAQAKANLDAFEQDTSPTPRQTAVAARLRSATSAYDALKGALEKADGGKIAAVTVIRQREFADALGSHPLVYLTSTKVGLTAMTKKGFFTGMFGQVPAYGYGTAVFDYLIVLPGQPAARGSVVCTAAKRKTEDLLAIDVGALADAGATLCS